MINKEINIKTKVKCNEAVEGETLEMKIMRITTNNEPITDGAPLIYTERKDGVMAGHNIRTDRWEIALEAMDKVSRTTAAKRANIIEMKPNSQSEVNTSDNSDSK